MLYVHGQHAFLGTRGLLTIFNNKLVTRTYCDKTGDYALPKGLSPRNLERHHTVYGADQLDSYCTADLSLCLHICRLLVYLCEGSNYYVI